MPKELFPGSTDFTGAIFKIPQISKQFSAMLLPNNLDKKTNKYGRSLNEMYISNDLHFLNGRA